MRHHIADKGPSSQAVVFPVVMYGCESWTTEKAESWRVDAFELWCWQRLLTAKRSNKFVLKEIKPEYLLEGLMFKLKLQYFGHLMERANSLEKTLMLEKIEGKRRRGWHRARWLDSITDSMDGHKFEQTLGDSEGQRSLACCSPWSHKESDRT